MQEHALVYKSSIWIRPLIITMGWNIFIAAVSYGLTFIGVLNGRWPLLIVLPSFLWILFEVNRASYRKLNNELSRLCELDEISQSKKNIILRFYYALPLGLELIILITLVLGAATIFLAFSFYKMGD